VDGEVGVEGGVQGGAGRGDADLGEAEHLECGDGRAWVKRWHGSEALAWQRRL